MQGCSGSCAMAKLGIKVCLAVMTMLGLGRVEPEDCFTDWLPGRRGLQGSLDSPLWPQVDKPLLIAFDSWKGVRIFLRGSFKVTQRGHSETCLTSSQVPLRLLGDYELSDPSSSALLAFLHFILPPGVQCLFDVPGVLGPLLFLPVLPFWFPFYC